MIAKKMATTLALVIVAATAGLAASSPTLAGGYGYGSGNSWGGYQSHRPVRQKVYRRAYNGNNPHLAWCYDRYRSYRQSDNTFQPYHGPRKDCLSPYVAERLALFADYRQDAPEQLFQEQVDGSGQSERDQFGNLRESARNSASPEGGTDGQADGFGNLPEQAAAAAGTDASTQPDQPVNVQQAPAAAQAPAELETPVAVAPVVAVEAPPAESEAAPVAVQAVEAPVLETAVPSAEGIGPEEGQSETE